MIMKGGKEENINWFPFQSLTEDVARQTEREKQLQSRFAALQDELQGLRAGPVAGAVENKATNGHVNGDSEEREKEEDDEDEESGEEDAPQPPQEEPPRQEMEVDG